MAERLELNAEVSQAINDFARVQRELKGLGSTFDALSSKRADIDTSSFDKLSKLAAQARKSIDQVTTANMRLGGTATVGNLLSAGFASFAANAKTAFLQTTTTVEGLAKTFTTAKGAIIAFFAVQATRFIGQFVSGFVEMTREVIGFEAAMTSVHAILNTAANPALTLADATRQAGQDFEYVKHVSFELGHSLATMAHGFKSFATAATLSGESMSTVKDAFQKMSAVATVLHLPEEKIKRVFLALEQMYSKGKVMSEELRRQFGDAIPGAVSVMAQSLGVTTKQLDKMLRLGQVGTDAIAGMINQFYENLSPGLATVLDSPIVALGRIQNALESLQAVFGVSFFGPLTLELNVLSRLLGSSGMETSVRLLGSAFGLLTAVLGAAVTAVVGVVSAFGYLVQIITAPIRLLGLVSSAVSNLVSAFGQVTGISTVFSAVFSGISSVVSGVVSAISSAATAFYDFFSVTNSLGETFNFLDPIISAVGIAISSAAGYAILAGGGFAVLATAVSRVLSIFTPLIALLAPVGSALVGIATGTVSLGAAYAAAGVRLAVFTTATTMVGTALKTLDLLLGKAVASLIAFTVQLVATPILTLSSGLLALRTAFTALTVRVSAAALAVRGFVLSIPVVGWVAGIATALIIGADAYMSYGDAAEKASVKAFDANKVFDNQKSTLAYLYNGLNEGKLSYQEFSKAVEKAGISLDKITAFQPPSWDNFFPNIDPDDTAFAKMEAQLDEFIASVTTSKSDAEALKDAIGGVALSSDKFASATSNMTEKMKEQNTFLAGARDNLAAYATQLAVMMANAEPGSKLYNDLAAQMSKVTAQAQNMQNQIVANDAAMGSVDALKEKYVDLGLVAEKLGKTPTELIMELDHKNLPEEIARLKQELQDKGVIELPPPLIDWQGLLDRANNFVYGIREEFNAAPVNIALGLVTLANTREKILSYFTDIFADVAAMPQDFADKWSAVDWGGAQWDVFASNMGKDIDFISNRFSVLYNSVANFGTAYRQIGAGASVQPVLSELDQLIGKIATNKASVGELYAAFKNGTLNTSQFNQAMQNIGKTVLDLPGKFKLLGDSAANFVPKSGAPAVKALQDRFKELLTTLGYSKDKTAELSESYLGVAFSQYNATKSTEQLTKAFLSQLNEVTRIKTNVAKAMQDTALAIARLPEGALRDAELERMKTLADLYGKLGATEKDLSIKVEMSQAEGQLREVNSKVDEATKTRVMEILADTNSANLATKLKQVEDIVKNSGLQSGKGFQDEITKGVRASAETVEVTMIRGGVKVTETMRKTAQEAGAAASGMSGPLIVESGKMTDAIMSVPKSLMEFKQNADGSYSGVSMAAEKAGAAVKAQSDKMTEALKQGAAAQKGALSNMGPDITNSITPVQNAVTGITTSLNSVAPAANGARTSLSSLGTQTTNFDAVSGSATRLGDAVASIGPKTASALGAVEAATTQSADTYTVWYTSAAEYLEAVRKRTEDAGNAMNGVSEKTATLGKNTADVAGDFERVGTAASSASTSAGSVVESIRNVFNQISLAVEKLLTWNSTPMYDKTATVTVTQETAPVQAREGLYMPSYAIGTANTSTQQSSVSGGGIPAVLHPGEAVIPLSGGRSVPVEFKTAPERNTVNRAAPASSEGGKATVVNITIQAEDVDSFRRSQAQIYADMRREMTRAVEKISK